MQRLSSYARPTGGDPLKAPALNYARPESLAQAFALLVEHGDAAQVLAGGQSLVPMLNLRLAQPDLLVDITRLPGLGGISVTDGRVRIGALVTHREIEHNLLVARHAPLLAKAVPHIAHVAIRNSGTLGGSVALADPAAEYPACLVALEADIVVGGVHGERQVSAADFFLGLYTTALEPGELVTAVEFAAQQPGQICAFAELARRHGDYAMVGLAACARREGTGASARLTGLRLGFLGAGPTPMLAAAAAAAVEGQTLSSSNITAAQSALDADLAPLDDLNAQSATKMHLARVLLARVLRELAE